MSKPMPYLVGVTNGKTGQVLGPYHPDEVQAPIRGEQALREEGADEVYAVRATSHLEARRKVRERL